MVEAVFYWISVIPLLFLHSMGLNVGKVDGGWLDPSGFGYGILGVAVWLIAFGLALIIRRE